MAPLLLLCFIYAIFLVKAQDSTPKLIVDPAVISEASNVTITCQTYVQEADCYFRLDKSWLRSCRSVLSGAELLSRVNRQPPVNITVTCFYYHTNNPSAYSDERIITIKMARPSLTVNSSVITKKDHVQICCRPPPSVSFSTCHFLTTNGHSWESSSCLKTVRGSDLMVNQSPAEVQIQCYYVVQRGEAISTSLHSEKISVSIQRTRKNKLPNQQQLTKPDISFEQSDDEVFIFCSLPLSANGSKCNLYFGESTQSYRSTNSRTTTKKNELFCQFIVSVNYFVSNLSKVSTKKVICDYTLENGDSSPRSDGHSSKAFISRFFPNHSPETTVSSHPVKTTTGLNHVTGSDSETASSVDVNRETTTKMTPGHVTGSDSVTTSSVTQSHVTTDSLDTVKTRDPHHVTDQSNPENSNLKLMISVTVCGVLLGSIVLLSLAFFCIQQRNANHRNNGSQEKATEYANIENHPMKPFGHKPIEDDDKVYTMITSVPTANCSKGSVNATRHQSTDDNESNTYHLYCTITYPEEVTGGSVDNVLYSSLQD